MLTTKQKQLLLYIDDRIKTDGVSPSFDEMKDALNLASKSGIHRLIKALEERGFIRRLPNRARALEVVKMPESAAGGNIVRAAFRPNLISEARIDAGTLPVMGRIAAGLPIEAIEHEQARVTPPAEFADPKAYYALEVRGDSMIGDGILDGDTVILKHSNTAESGEIIVALVDKHEATLKRLRKKGKSSLALEASNPAYETRIFGPDQVDIQGVLVALVRRYA